MDILHLIGRQILQIDFLRFRGQAARPRVNTSQTEQQQQDPHNRPYVATFTMFHLDSSLRALLRAASRQDGILREKFEARRCSLPNSTPQTEVAALCAPRLDLDVFCVRYLVRAKAENSSRGNTLRSLSVSVSPFPLRV